MHIHLDHAKPVAPHRRSRSRRGLALTLAAIVALALTALGVIPSAARATSCPRPHTPTLPSFLPYSTGFGTPQHLDCATSDGGPIEFGELREPPTATHARAGDLSVVAHWYGGFGLEQTLAGSNWKGWYDWRWNSTANTGNGRTAVGYDPARAPLIGNYRGDDPRVLGWIAYWLASAGVTGVSFTDTFGFSTDDWNGPVPNWQQQYFENTPNAAALDYVLSVGNRGGVDAIRTRANQLVDFVAKHPGVAVETVGDRRYAMVNVWDLESLRGQFDGYNGARRSEAFLLDLTARFRAIGYDGVTLLARNAGVIGSHAAALEQSGLRVQFASYEGKYGSSSSYTDYADYVDTVDYAAATKGRPNTVLGVFTSLDTVYPHTSGYKIGGSTPELFAADLTKARRYILDNDLPRVLTVYNVSEWAEGGPGLVPNMRDGFGYLEALRSVLVSGCSPIDG